MKNSSAYLFLASCLFSFVIAPITLNYYRSLPSEKDITQKLSTNQKRKVISQIGLNGFELMKEVNCNLVVAERMNTGKWVDSWCGDKYKHLELD